LTHAAVGVHTLTAAGNLSDAQPRNPAARVGRDGIAVRLQRALASAQARFRITQNDIRLR
jgi:hypothetical protein